MEVINDTLLSIEPDESQAQSVTGLTIEDPNKASLPQKVVDLRAQKANFALGDKSPGLESLRGAIGRGDENFAREQAAVAVDLKNREQRMQIIERIAKDRPDGAVTPEEMDLVKGLTQEQLENPNTIFETEYGKKMISQMALNKKAEDALVNKQMVRNPDDTIDTMDFGASILARQEIAKTKLEELEARWEDSGMWDKVGDYAKSVIPFKSWSNISNEVPGFKGAGFDLLGSNLKEQVQYLWSLPPKEFEQKLSETLKGIAASSTLDAQTFAQAVISFSASDQIIQNTFAIADLVDLGTVAVGGAKLTRSALRGTAAREGEAQVKKAVADVLKASREVGTTPDKVLEVSGDTTKATVSKAIRGVMAESVENPALTGPERFTAIRQIVPSLIDPIRALDDIGNLTGEAASRLYTKLKTNAERLTDGIVDPVQATRLTPEALVRATENAKAELSKEFKHLNDSVLDIVKNERDVVTNTDSVSIRLGDMNAQPFESLERAEVWAKDLHQLPEGSYTIKQEGTNFFIDVPRTIDETADNVRDLAIDTHNKTPVSNSWATMYLGWLRSPAETASAMARANRNVAGLAQENSLKFVKEVAKSIGDIPKKNRKDFETVLKSNRDWVDPATSQRGRFYGTVGQLEEGYLQTVGRMPTEKEVQAYFSYVQLSDYDWILRNTVMLRDKQRIGLKNFSFEYRGAFEDGEPFYTKTKAFEGKEVDRIPWGSEHLGVLIYDTGTHQAQVVGRLADGGVRSNIDKMIREGYKIIQVADPVARPLKEVSGSNEPIQYVLTKGYEKTELSLKQVGYAPGGHVEYKGNYWVKQPKLYSGEGGRYYEGDTTAFNFTTRAQAEKFAKRMEQGRQLLNDDAGLERFLEKNLPYSRSSFKQLFEEGGYFDPKQPFFHSESSQKYSDIVPLDKEVKNLSSSSFNLNDDLDRTFTGQRNENLLPIKEIGTNERPVFDMSTDQLIDPMSTLARGIGQVTRSKFFGDMKTHAAESFVEEFHTALKGSLEELRKAPMAALMKPEWNDKVPAELLARAKYTQANAVTFIGQQTPFGAKLEWTKNKIADAVYKTLGQDAADTLSNSALMASRDPLSYFRAAAFHMKLGLFNPVQLVVQAQGLTHMVALSPRQAPAAMSGYTLMRRLMLNSNPEIVDGAARMSTKLGWREGEFKEAYETMNRSGWNNVGREQALLDDMSDPTLYQGTVGKFLDKGTIFFNEGERMTRMASWNAAYLEFRKANRTVAIGDREIGQIMNRADTLSLNMTRASKSQLEQGIFSIPAQFSSYQFRMMDQMLGKQLTVGEKLRAFGAYSALYGVPMGVAGVTGIPFYEEIRKMALENGVTVNDTFLNTLIEGIPSAIMTAVTGEEYNIAQRYGPGGIGMLKDWWTDDKTLTEIAMGASGQVLKDILKSVDPVRQGLTDVFFEGGSYEPLVADLIQASQSISSVNNTLRMAMALNTGKYITKNDTYLSNMSTMDAIFSGIAGITPREVSDAFLMSRSLKETKDLQTEAEKQFQRYYRRGLNEGATGNNKAMEAYFKRARAYLVLGDFQPTQYAEIMGRAVANQGSVIDRISQSWFKQAPGSQMEKRFKQTLENANQRTQ